jgi:hypothetical protein
LTWLGEGLADEALGRSRLPYLLIGVVDDCRRLQRMQQHLRAL